VDSCTYAQDLFTSLLDAVCFDLALLTYANICWIVRDVPRVKSVVVRDVPRVKSVVVRDVPLVMSVVECGVPLVMSFVYSLV